jgi:hypothetical protein
MQFLTPYAALFALAALVPLAALVVTQRRADAVRRVLGVGGPGRRALVPVVIALLLLPCLVAVAAAQPVVVHQSLVKERSDAQAFVVFDTSLSMGASPGVGKPDRLARAKQLALRLEHALPDLPMGVASMTDRTLPNLMPTTDRTLFDRTVEQSVAIDRPPPSQPHPLARATTFEALVPLVQSQYYARFVQRRLLVVFTDGESAKISPVFRLTLQRRVTPVFVHVWDGGERIYGTNGKPDSHYAADPSSTAALANLASVTGGSEFTEDQFSKIVHASRDAVGHAEAHTTVSAYAREPLAPWFVLAAIVPLAYLLWRRNL